MVQWLALWTLNPAIRVQISVGPKQQFLGWLLKPLFFMLFCKPHVLSKLTEKLTSERKGRS